MSVRTAFGFIAVCVLSVTGAGIEEFLSWGHLFQGHLMGWSLVLERFPLPFFQEVMGNRWQIT